jgi:hypothetical protein
MALDMLHAPKTLAAKLAGQGLWLLVPNLASLIGSGGHARPFDGLNRLHGECTGIRPRGRSRRGLREVKSRSPGVG